MTKVIKLKFYVISLFLISIGFGESGKYIRKSVSSVRSLVEAVKKIKKKLE